MNSLATPTPRRLIVALTGASGSRYARLLCEELLRLGHYDRIALLVSPMAEQVAAFEDEAEWMADPRLVRYEVTNLFAPPASGSAEYEAMVIVPCSMGCVGRIAAGVSTDLITRAADVMLKERRRLIVVPRETPMSTIHLRNLLTLSEAGAIIAPAAPSFYAHPDSLDVLCMSVVERLLSLLGVASERYQWGADS